MHSNSSRQISSTMRDIRNYPVEISTDAIWNGPGFPVLHAGYISVKPEGEPARLVLSTPHVFISDEGAQAVMDGIVQAFRRTV